ncbi:2-hydroxyacylsphingosine 1-beta-galactosyltransferase-like [Glandiceps talaboti]
MASLVVSLGILAVVVSQLIGDVSCSNILIVPSMSVGSRFFVMAQIARNLNEQGHRVTIVVSSVYYEDIVQSSDWSNITLERFKGVMDMDDNIELFSDVALSGTMNWFHISIFLYNYSEDCVSLFSDETFIKRLQKSTFDLVIACEFTPCAALVAHFLDLPFVLVGATRIIPVWDADMFYIPNNPAYIPCVASGLPDEMNFLQRTYNTLYFVMRYITINIVFTPYGKVKQKYNIKPELGIRDVYADAELFFVNTDVVLNFPRPIMPNVIFLGSSFLIRPVHPLERELEDFVQSSGDNGIVVLSFGGHAKFTKEEQFKEIAEALGKLPQKIVAKYNGDRTPSYLKGNGQFKLMKWLPQNDLLAHPKTKAIIYHGGLNGVHEIIHHAVPMVGVPLFHDQHENVQAVAKHGMAIVLQMKTLTAEELYEAVSTVIKDPSYKENAMRLSRIVKDTPMSAKDILIYWIEYVIKYGGKHLKSQAVNLNFVQYYLIDVFVFVIGLTLTSVFIAIKTYTLLRTKRKEKTN